MESYIDIYLRIQPDLLNLLYFFGNLAIIDLSTAYSVLHCTLFCVHFTVCCKGLKI